VSSSGANRPINVMPGHSLRRTASLPIAYVPGIHAFQTYCE
jgi:hypothetical protein